MRDTCVEAHMAMHTVGAALGHAGRVLEASTVASLERSPRGISWALIITLY